MRCLLALLNGGALCTALADQAWAQTLPPPVPETEQQELVVQGRAWPQGRLDEAVRPLA